MRGILLALTPITLLFVSLAALAIRGWIIDSRWLEERRWLKAMRKFPASEVRATIVFVVTLLAATPLTYYAFSTL